MNRRVTICEWKEREEAFGDAYGGGGRTLTTRRAAKGGGGGRKGGQKEREKGKKGRGLTTRKVNLAGRAF